jgi:hypothetical protein
MSQLISMLGLLDDQGDGQMYVQKINGGVTDTYAITGTFGTADSGATRLVSGILFQWGKMNFTDTEIEIDFFQSFGTTVYSITFSVETSDGTPATANIAAGSLGPSAFKVFSNQTGVTGYYIAIGV